MFQYTRIDYAQRRLPNSNSICVNFRHKGPLVVSYYYYKDSAPCFYSDSVSLDQVTSAKFLNKHLRL